MKYIYTILALFLFWILPAQADNFLETSCNFYQTPPGYCLADEFFDDFFYVGFNPGHGNISALHFGVINWNATTTVQVYICQGYPQRPHVFGCGSNPFLSFQTIVVPPRPHLDDTNFEINLLKPVQTETGIPHYFAINADRGLSIPVGEFNPYCNAYDNYLAGHIRNYWLPSPYDWDLSYDSGVVISQFATYYADDPEIQYNILEPQNGDTFGSTTLPLFKTISYGARAVSIYANNGSDNIVIHAESNINIDYNASLYEHIVNKSYPLPVGSYTITFNFDNFHERITATRTIEVLEQYNLGNVPEPASGIFPDNGAFCLDNMPAIFYTNTTTACSPVYYGITGTARLGLEGVYNALSDFSQFFTIQTARAQGQAMAQGINSVFSLGWSINRLFAGFPVFQMIIFFFLMALAFLVFKLSWLVIKIFK